VNSRVWGGNRVVAVQGRSVPSDLHSGTTYVTPILLTMSAWEVVPYMTEGKKKGAT